MLRHPRVLLALSLFLLLGTAVIALLVFPRDSSRQIVRLPTGEEYRLEAVTYGTTHRWVEQTWWQKLQARFLPASLGSTPSTYRSMATVGSTPGVGFWLKGELKGPFRFEQLMQVFVVDETGREYAQAAFTAESRANREVIAYCLVPAPPGKEVSLRFYDPASSRSSTLTVPNAMPCPAGQPIQSTSQIPPLSSTVPPPPPANTAPCPVTKRIGTTSLTLLRLETGLSGGGRTQTRPEVLFQPQPVAVAPGEFPWTRLAFRLSGAANGWDLAFTSIRDAGEFLATQQYQRQQNGEIRTAVAGFLAPTGPYMVRATLQRRGERGVYRPEQLWTLRNVKVPKSGEETFLNTSRTVQGVQLELRSVGAQEPVLRSAYEDPEAQHSLRLKATGLGPKRQLSVWVVDASGKPHSARQTYPNGPDSTTEYRFRVPEKLRSGPIAIHLAVHAGLETRMVDFAVQPSPTPSASVATGESLPKQR